jgi:Flp pilus assembly protein TadD
MLKKPPAMLVTTPLSNALPLGQPEELKASGQLSSAAPQKASANAPPKEEPAKQSPAGQSSQSSANQQSKGQGAGLSAEQFYLQGRARFDRREYHAAVHLLREAIKLDASKPQYHFHLGIALMRNPRTRREADEHLVKALELDPYNSQIRLKLAMLYKEVGLTKKAEHYFRETLSMDPDNRLAQREMNSETTKKKEAGSIWKSDLGSVAKRIFRK